MAYTTRTTPASDYTAEMVTLTDTLPSGRSVHIDAVGPDENGRATVNWSGIGSVNTSDAKAYADLLLAAAGLAGGLSPATRPA